MHLSTDIQNKLHLLGSSDPQESLLVLLLLIKRRPGTSTLYAAAPTSTRLHPLAQFRSSLGPHTRQVLANQHFCWPAALRERRHDGIRQPVR